ncbi:hypothetical protein PT273_05590 [Orbaceae bacterium ESL0727]|nr:hypothetical protein [Orbaceae bacterium ESL0727]
MNKKVDSHFPKRRLIKRLLLGSLFIILIIIIAITAGYFYKNRSLASVTETTTKEGTTLIIATPKKAPEASAIIAGTQDNHFTKEQLFTLSQQMGAKLVQFELKPQGSCAEQQARFAQAQKMLGEKSFAVAGMEEGAAFAYRWLTTQSDDNASALSIEFTLDHKDCDDPLPKQASHGKWTVIWNNPPDDDVALFPREQKTIQVNTAIGEYDATPTELLSLHLASVLFGEREELPVIELPVNSSKPETHPHTVTFYYSGDGGWRDLDKVSAEYMQTHGYSVVGVDALKLFWQHRSPERSAKDLANLMQQYREKWGATQFVLAGYSFGGDMLPALYNRLSTADQNSVKALILIAFSKTADFEIDVTGWVGGTADETQTGSEVSKIPSKKLFCIYGKDEKKESGCLQKEMTGEAFQLPGGHHFDENYDHLGQVIMNAIDKRMQ